MDESGISSLLNTVTALIGHLISQVFIDADRILVGIHVIEQSRICLGEDDRTLWFR